MNISLDLTVYSIGGQSLVVPLLFALDALVERGAGLIGRADLDLHEVRLGVLAVWAARCNSRNTV